MAPPKLLVVNFPINLRCYVLLGYRVINVILAINIGDSAFFDIAALVRQFGGLRHHQQTESIHWPPPPKPKSWLRHWQYHHVFNPDLNVANSIVTTTQHSRRFLLAIADRGSRIRIAKSQSTGTISPAAVIFRMLTTPSLQEWKRRRTNSGRF